jgi:hypothetical protein
MRKRIPSLIRSMIDATRNRKNAMLFEEDDYLNAHPDIAAAVKSGSLKSGRDHYTRHGMKEGRFPGFRGFDPERYYQKHPQLLNILTGERDNFARDHFRVIGFPERWNF